MCGITALYAILQNEGQTNNVSRYKYKQLMLDATKKIRHRGPDWSGIYENTNANIYISMAHERLEIIDPQGGAQPIVHNVSFRGEEIQIALCVNGEIYNHSDLRKKYANFPYKTKSDCEVIIPLYLEYFNKIHSCIDDDTNNDNNSDSDIYQKSATNMLEQIDGMFSFVIYNSYNNSIFVARDPIGITSLYYGYHMEPDMKDNCLFISSEMKALDMCEKVLQFPAGHFISSELGHFKPIEYFSKTMYGGWINGGMPSNTDNNNTMTNIYTIMAEVRKKFTKSVKKRLMTDVPFGILLSGGLDSSLVASVAVKLIREENLDLPWGKDIHTFSIGLEGSPDLAYAQKVADFLGTKHHAFTMTVEEGINAIKDVVYHIETYDVTTIRASTPMYLLARKIKAMGVKMVLSGEGSDELLGGYLYFKNAPSDVDFHQECVMRMRNLQYSDCQRANKSTMSWGVEGRFPFLDEEFMDYVMGIHPSLKFKDNIEKWVLRKAFDLKGDDGNPVYLPDEVLWRQKEQFSDGVGYNWINSLVSDCQNKYNDPSVVSASSLKYLVNPPIKPEALYYRELYEEIFPNRDTAVKLWIPRTDWGCSADPSGRAQKSHISYDTKLV